MNELLRLRKNIYRIERDDENKVFRVFLMFEDEAIGLNPNDVKVLVKAVENIEKNGYRWSG